MPLQAQQIQCLQRCFPRVSKSSPTNHPLPSLGRDGHPQRIPPYGKSRTAMHSRGSNLGFPPSFPQGQSCTPGLGTLQRWGGPSPSAPALCIFTCSPGVVETWLDRCLQAREQNQALPGSGNVGSFKRQVKIRCLKGIWGSSVWKGAGEGWYRWLGGGSDPCPPCLAVPRMTQMA